MLLNAYNFVDVSD